MILLVVALPPLLQLAFGASLTQTVDNSCPSRRVEIIGREYFTVNYGFCYLFAEYDRVVYDDARSTCIKYGGILAMPKTKVVNDFLIEKLKGFPYRGPMWIGMNDLATENTYVWEDGTPVRDWGNFDGGNGGFMGDGEDCIALDPSDGNWHDYGCRQNGILSRLSIFRNARLPFICQFSVPHGIDDTTSAGDQGNDDTAGAGDQIDSGITGK